MKAEGMIDIIASCVQVDEIINPGQDGTSVLVGGAGLYAAIGCGLAGGRPALATGIGADYRELLGHWLDANDVITDGLRVPVEQTPRNRIVYGSEDRRTETPVFGLSHFKSCEPTPADVAGLLPVARSAYLFADSDPAFWAAIRAAKDADPKACKYLWEVSSDACDSAQRDAFSASADCVDAVSMNVGEARALTGLTDADEAIVALGELTSTPIFLRAGDRGCHVLHRGGKKHVPTITVATSDVTGGGNAFSGAATVALAQGKDLADCARIGTAAALVTITRRGPFDMGPGSTGRAAFETYLQTLGDGVTPASTMERLTH